MRTPAASKRVVKGGGELHALVGVEDFGLAMLEGLLEGIETEQAVQGVGELPGQDEAAVPVHDRHKIHETVRHGDIGDVGAPDLIGSFYR